MRTPFQAEDPPARPLAAGDYARLRRDEPGDIVTAFSGDWGQVSRINRDGTADLMLAGFCRPRTAPSPRALSIPISILERCDGYGRATVAPRRRNWANPALG